MKYAVDYRVFEVEEQEDNEERGVVVTNDWHCPIMCLDQINSESAKYGHMAQEMPSIKCDLVDQVANEYSYRCEYLIGTFKWEAEMYCKCNYPNIT